MSVDQIARGGTFDMGRVVSSAITAATKHATVLFPVALGFAVLSNIIATYGVSGIEPTQMMTSPIYWATMLFATLGGFILQAYVIHIVVDGLRGNQPSIGSSLAAAFRSLIPLILTGLLVTLGAYVGMILLIVPGIILFVMWSVAVPVVVVERVGPLQAMGRSRFLTKGSRWAIFGLSLAAIVVIMILSFAIYGFNVTAMAAAAQSPNIGRIIAASLLGCVTSVLMSAGIAAIYSELRMIKEGVSNDQLAAAFD
jgi:uncharacterized membrane protein